MQLVVTYELVNFSTYLPLHSDASSESEKQLLLFGNLGRDPYIDCIYVLMYQQTYLHSYLIHI